MEIFGFERLKNIGDIVNSDIETRTDAIISQAESECEKIRAGSGQNELGAAFETISFRKKEIGEKHRAITAFNAQNNRKAYLLRREELTDDIFLEVKKMLEEYSKSDEYPKLLKKRCDNCGDCVVLLSKRDMKFSGVLEMPCRETEDIVLGGLMLLYEDRGVIIDKSFDSFLADQRSRFGESYGAILFGGAVK